MLNLDALAPAQRGDRPFAHYVTPPGSILSTATCNSLYETFPSRLLRFHRRNSGPGKTYALSTRSLVASDEQQVDSAVLGPGWAEMVADVMSAPYRSTVLESLGIGQSKCEIELRITEHDRDGYMSRHTDRPEKLFSQIIYLCPAWRSEDGGRLLLFESARALKPMKTITPALGNSVLFARSERSWHEVEAVSTATRNCRRSILIHGYRPST